MITPNRIVALLAPIFAGLAGWIVQLIAQYFPGAPNLDKGELTAIFIAGAAAGLGGAWKWLSGWISHEANMTHLEMANGNAQNVLLAGDPTEMDGEPSPPHSTGGKPGFGQTGTGR